jgi:nucleotide-binding universal stress UspA family protein
MRKVLVPISADREQMQSAVAEIVSMHPEEAVEVHLLNVQPTIPGYVANFFKDGNLRQIQEEVGREELAPAQALLDAAGIACISHVEAGHGAETIVRTARRLGCDRIVMGRSRPAGVTEKLFGTLANQVRHLAGAAGNCQVIGS